MVKYIESICYMLLFFSAFSVPSEKNNDIEVRKITPPILDAGHLGKRIFCHRPMRAGSPRMEVSRCGNKVIAHNYGHGGSGWTLAPGAVDYINNLFIHSIHTQDLTKDAEITILGAGVIGLFTAYDLYVKGFRNLTIIAENFSGICSSNAGGLFAPHCIGNDVNVRSVIDNMVAVSYKVYESIAHGKHADLTEGVKIIPAYFDSRQASGLEPYVGQVMKPAKDVVLDFGNGITRQMVVYDDAIFIDTSAVMSALTEFLISNHIPFVKKKVTSFTELAGTYIINCVGLGARILSDDESLFSVQGHILMLKDQLPEDMQYMIVSGRKHVESESGYKTTRVFSIFPKIMPGSGSNDIGVIGGTAIEGADASTPNDKEFDILVDGAKAFYGL